MTTRGDKFRKRMLAFHVLDTLLYIDSYWWFWGCLRLLFHQAMMILHMCKVAVHVLKVKQNESEVKNNKKLHS